jgi:hypothetical protein
MFDRLFKVLAADIRRMMLFYLAVGLGELALAMTATVLSPLFLILAGANFMLMFTTYTDHHRSQFMREVTHRALEGLANDIDRDVTHRVTDQIVPQVLDHVIDVLHRNGAEPNHIDAVRNAFGTSPDGRPTMRH